MCVLQKLPRATGINTKIINLGHDYVYSISFEFDTVWASSRENLSLGFATRGDKPVCAVTETR